MELVAKIGGMLTALVFLHFAVDWLFQSDKEAVAKSKNWGIRLKHCLIYSTPFMLLMIVVGCRPATVVWGTAILWSSHFIGDTYAPVYLWARWIRRPPCMKKDPAKGFVEFVTTPLGKIVVIGVDQIVHTSFLVLVAWLMIRS